MNAALLLEHYARIADAPNAIARLRQFVLDLVVRGKLVDQDAGDEPASELLKRIAAERSRLVKTGEIRKPKPLPAVDDPLFDLPFNWAWVPIREITSDRGQAIPGAPFTYIDVTAINKEAGVVAKPKVLASADAPSRARKITQKGDVIYSCVRPYLLNVAVIEQDFDPAPIASTAFAILNGYGLVLPRYIWIVLRTPFMIECVEATQRGQAYPAINDADFAVLPFPLPPLAEQHRIVAKVDELMALCDQLEAARAEREAVRDTFTLSTLAKLNTPDHEKFGQDARFVLANLTPLTNRPDQIKQLRRTILNLAVRGKLVEQDPSDKPASDLLKQIATERVRLVKLGELRREKPFEPIKTTELPFDLPKGWSWARLGSLIHLISGQHLQPNEYSETANAGLPYITGPSDFGSNGLQISRFALVRKAVAKRGQLLLTVKGSGVGKTTTCNIPEVAISRQLMALTAIEWDRQFLVLVTHRLAEALQASARSLIPGISREDVEQFVLGVPPLAEQHRIVAKVDELMAVCDRLEACITTGEQTRSRLLEAVLHKALEPA